MGLREAILKVAHQLVGIVAEEDRRDTLLTRSDQDGAERAFTDSEADLLVRATGAILRRRHSEHVRGLLVETTARIETRVVNRLGDAIPGLQTLADLCCALCGGIVLRGQARGGLEHAMEMADATSDGIGQIVQRGLFLALLDQA